MKTFTDIRKGELFHADRRTDMQLIVAFRNFAKAPEENCGNLCTRLDRFQEVEAPTLHDNHDIRV